MTAQERKILVAYEELGAKVEDIAVELNLDLSVVTYALATHSSMYRQSRVAEVSGPNTQEDVDADESRLYLGVIKELAITSLDDRIRLQAAQFLFNERKGRNEIKVAAPTNVVSIESLNLQLTQAMSKAIAYSAQKPVIDLAVIPKEGLTSNG